MTVADWVTSGAPFDIDLGDAPAPYPSLLAESGARHGATGPTLGAARDTESDGQPTVGADGDDNDGTGTGVFTSSITGLTGNGQTYYVRAYATNSAGTSYGDQKVFATPMTVPGNALDFDGTDDYVGIPDDNSLDLISNYTLEAWIYPTSFATMAGIVSKYQSIGANGYVVRLTDTSPYTGLSFDGTNTAIVLKKKILTQIGSISQIEPI